MNNRFTRMKNIKITPLPEHASDLPVDLHDIGKCQLTGLIYQRWRADGNEYGIFTYIAEGMHYNRPCIIIAPPSGENVSDFLLRYGLIQFARKSQVFLCLLEPPVDDWAMDGKAADFMNAAYKKVLARDYYVAMQDNIYAFGFGDGASVAQQAVMKMASEWSGLATFGNLSFRVMQTADGTSDKDAGTQSGETQILAKRCQVPVWMYLDDTTGTAAQVIQFWKKENHSLDEPLFDCCGTEIYLPVPVQSTSKLNDEHIAQVRISHKDWKEHLSCQELDKVWAYIGSARRHRGYDGKFLRYYREPLKNGAQHHSMSVDGIQREWYEYVPQRVRESDKAVPLVVVLHGRGGDAESFFDITDMSVVAEERGFIALFPTADFYQAREHGLCSVRVWDGNYQGQRIDSCIFLRQMIEDAKSRLPVDSGRIYACGQSSGGKMASCCAMAMSDIFTAAAPWSGVSCPSSSSNLFCYPYQTAFSTGNVPIFLTVGENDGFFDVVGFDPISHKNGLLHDYLRFLRSAFHLAETPLCYQCPPISYWVWRNQKGTPMLKLGIVRNMAHANYAEQSRIAYDEFFAQFSRAADGTLLYMGQSAE